MFGDGSESLFLLVGFLKLGKLLSGGFLVQALWSNVLSSTDLKNVGVEVAPGFETSKLISSWDLELFSELWLRLLSLFFWLAHLEETLGCNGGGGKDSSERRSEEVSFLSWERWVHIDFGV